VPGLGLESDAVDNVRSKLITPPLNWIDTLELLNLSGLNGDTVVIRIGPIGR